MKTFLKNKLPFPVVSILRFLRHTISFFDKIHESYLVRTQPQRYAKIVNGLREKETIKVAFFAIHSSVWKYDSLYHLMCKHPRFEPVVVVCPVVNYDFDNMLSVMDKCYNMFKKKGYNVVRTYDVATENYIDVKKEINPDIVFYTNPYRGLIDDKYFITNFLDRLTCYVSYNFGNSNFYEMFHNQLMHNLVWRMFAETEEHKLYSQLHAKNKAYNVTVTGYPGIDIFLDKSYHPIDIWKVKKSDVKRIIWAPHHTFQAEEVVRYSCFLEYYQFMLELAHKYRDKIQIAFKPHPLLKVKLDNYWGKEKADFYYSQWDNMPNSMFVDGDYIDLFLSSDAMIHDCGSFIVEYLYTLNPVMRTDNEIDPATEFNDFARECLNLHYHAHNTADIEDFVMNLINGVDSLKEDRLKFYKTKLLPPHGLMPSQNILDALLNSINN